MIHIKGIGLVRTKIELARLRLSAAARLTKSCSIGDQSVLVEVGNRRELGRARAYSIKEPDTVDWIAEYVKAGDVFYDVGSNIGLYSIFAAKRLEGQVKVYCFEPESQNYASLNRNVYLNGLSDSITTLCLALSDSSSIDMFYVRGNLRAGESIHQFGRATDDRGNPFSPVHRQGMFGISLDDLCFEYGLAFPTHINIDVDGQESSVIRGATRVLCDKRLRSVLLEITESPSRAAEAADIYETFLASGFELLKKVRISPQGEAYNAIFVRDSSPETGRPANA